MRKILLISFCLCLLSCQEKQRYFFNYPVAELAKTEKAFCLVLYDSLYNISNYMEKIDALASDHFIIDFLNVDQDDNQWYIKLLRPQILPVTCIFNSNGNIFDIIPGDSKESIRYVERTVTSEKMALDYHYNQVYGYAKMNMVRLYDNIFRYKCDLDSCTIESYSDIEEIDIIDTLAYPYPLILKMQHRLGKKDSLSAIKAAKEVVEQITSKDLLLYSDDLFIAHNIIDTSYNSRTAPVITLTPILFDLGECELGNTTVHFIKVKNTGCEKLNILEVLSSCSCINLLSEVENLVVSSGDEMEIVFTFTPDRKGELLREIYILSDSYQTPLVTIPITCQVK